MPDPDWAFVIRTKPSKEKTADFFLRSFGHSVYFPQTRELKAHPRTGEIKVVDRPFFSHYLFVWNAGQQISGIKYTPGVSGFVCCGLVPIQVNADVVQAIKDRERLVDEGIYRIVLEEREKGPGFHKDDRVKVMKGQFAGLSAIFQFQTSLERAMVFVNLFGRLNRASVRIADLEANPFPAV